MSITKYIIFSLLLFFLSNSTAQNYLNNKVKAQYVFSFGHFLDWDQYKDETHFKIAIYGNDTAMHQELHKALDNKKFHKKLTELKHYKTIDEIERSQILFIDEDKCEDIKAIYKKFEGKQVLIVSNRCDNSRETMINFLPIFFVRININTFNLEKEGFKSPPLLSAFAGKYELNFKELFSEAKDSLNKEKEVVEKKNKEIEKKEQDIAVLNHTLSNQIKLVEAKENELNNFSLQIKKQQSVLDEKTEFINQQENEITKQIKSINDFKQQSNIQKADIKTQEKIIEKRKDEILQQEQQIAAQKDSLNKVFKEMEKQKLIGYFITIVSVLLLILTIFLYYFYKNKKKANAELMDMNLKISKQKQTIEDKNKDLNQLVKEVTEQKDEIEAQRDEIEAQRDTVEAQRDKIGEIHQEMLHSLNYATRLQQSILPKTSIIQEYISDLFVLFKPKDKVSGDFYWWTHIEDHTIITASDCTGHGVPGAFMSMLGISFLREIVRKEYITHPGVILRKMRKEVIKALNQTGESGTHKDGMDMALISINHKTNVLQFSGANNPLYIIRNGELLTEDEAIKLYDFRNYDYKLFEIKPDKMPISIYEKMDKFTTHSIQLKKGDQIYLFSDGYADQFGGPKGKKFKYKPFKHLLLENANEPMSTQKEVLTKAFEEWKGKEDQIDDVVILGIKI